MRDSTTDATARSGVTHIDLATRRIIHEMLAGGARLHWERRARDFAAVGTPACDEIAEACRNRATLGWDGAGDADEEVPGDWTYTDTHGWTTTTPGWGVRHV